MDYRFCIVILSIFLVATEIQPAFGQAPSCIQWSNCSSCIGYSQLPCGWCPTTRRCINRSTTQCSDRSFPVVQCRGECESRLNCDSCLPSSNDFAQTCIWCASNSTCVVAESTNSTLCPELRDSICEDLSKIQPWAIIVIVVVSVIVALGIGLGGFLLYRHIGSRVSADFIDKVES